MTTTLTVPTEPLPFAIEDQSFEAWKRNGADLVRCLHATEETLRTLNETSETNQWDIGDWLVNGEKKFGKKAYPEAEQLTGWSRGTLYNVVWVVGKFKTLSLRSETKLSWSHFKELARVKDDKKREEVLQRFDDGFEHSVLDVRQHVDGVLSRKKPPNREPVAYVHASLKPTERAMFKALAKVKRKTPDGLLRFLVLKYIAEHKEDLASAKPQKSKARKR